MTTILVEPEVEVVEGDITTPPVVQVEGLRVAFEDGKSLREVVHGVDFSILPGRCLAIVGESGSGKSVTARTLVGLTGQNAVIEANALRLHGRDVRHFTQKQWRGVRGKEIGFISQDALVALDPFRKVGAEVGESLRVHESFNRLERRVKVLKSLTAVGVPEPEIRAEQRSFELSGGLRQRAVIASALITNPALLIADEPTTALDVTLQAQILQLISHAKQQGSAVLLISHDLAVVNALADDVLVMKDGEVVEAGAAADVLLNPKHEYTQKLKAAVPTANTRGARLAPHIESQISVLNGHEKRSAQGGAILEARGLLKTFGRRKGERFTAVQDVSLEVRPGKTLGIVGESGSGKSTTARILAGLTEPDTGDVRIAGQLWSDASHEERQTLRRRVGFVYQDPLSSFDPRWGVSRILEDAIRGTGLKRQERRERVTALLKLVGLGAEVADQHPLRLSGGQRQRVAIARALATDPDVIICDEPVSALDVSIQATILDLLKDIQERLNVAFVFISHDLGVVHHISDDVLVMKDAQVVERGSAHEVFTNPEHGYTKKLISALPTLP